MRSTITKSRRLRRRPLRPCGSIRGAPSALQLQADACFLSGRVGPALAAATEALAVNPRDESVLARAAACALVTDGVPSRSDLETWLTKSPTGGGPKSPGVSPRFWQIWTDVSHSDPKPGVFLADLGQLLEARRRFDAAEVCYRRAMSLAPQLPEAKTSLGMLLMRVGRTDQAHKILDEAFQADPYHTRVSNFRKVLKLLEGYQAISTEHFVVRVDSKLDKLLGGYIAEYLEEIYPQLVERFGYAPPQRTQIEIFNNSEGTSGHEWFSARMVGLPWIQTIGASTGVMVALASPTSAPVPFNWARVLRHEFVHVITVQQSGFNIPHWFTEALAVLNEGYPPPSEWMDLLARRFPSQLRTLATLDRGFQRPGNSDDLQFAYCQSRLYAEYMIERGGAESLRKMLAAYRENLSTPAAIKRVFGLDIADFERGYLDFLKSKVTGLHPAERPPSQSVTELEKQVEARPKDAALLGAYSWALLEKGTPGWARRRPRMLWQSTPSSAGRRWCCHGWTPTTKNTAQGLPPRTALGSHRSPRRNPDDLGQTQSVGRQSSTGGRTLRIGSQVLPLAAGFCPQDWRPPKRSSAMRSGWPRRSHTCASWRPTMPRRANVWPNWH